MIIVNNTESKKCKANKRVMENVITHAHIFQNYVCLILFYNYISN